MLSGGATVLLEMKDELGLPFSLDLGDARSRDDLWLINFFLGGVGIAVEVGLETMLSKRTASFVDANAFNCFPKFNIISDLEETLDKPHLVQLWLMRAHHQGFHSLFSVFFRHTSLFLLKESIISIWNRQGNAMINDPVQRRSQFLGKCVEVCLSFQQVITSLHKLL
ncbi:Cyclin delta-3 isoform 1 [Gossypium australe]|uniref:Cyclin delta-3 isoform 1 n=1 Tax=Gossypium australe TaxID=47621 RepID=A0A5B6VZ44_9ROSI|nr:Cyclin delta-3 isoform 1 [Gossypium australe]